MDKLILELKSGFKKYIDETVNGLKYKDVILSHALYPYRHSIGIEFLEIFRDDASLNRARELLEIYFKNKQDIQNPRPNSFTYLNSLKKFKDFIDIKYGGIDNIINRTFDNQHWVIPCNPKYYDIENAFLNNTILSWKQTMNVEKGDIVYIYVGGYIGEIKYKTRVIEVNLPTPTINDEVYQINNEQYSNYGRYMNIELLEKYDYGNYTKVELLQNGLGTIQGPSKANFDLIEFLEKNKKRINPNYYFVFQNKAFEEELLGRYLWAPKYDKHRNKKSFWSEIKNVKKGDYIIHSFQKNIIAIGEAKSNAYTYDRPLNLPEIWTKEGWKIDVEYHLIENPVVTSDIMDRLLKLQPQSNGPFNKIGRGNTVYLFKANKEMFDLIIEKTLNRNPGIIHKLFFKELLIGNVEIDKLEEEKLIQDLANDSIPDENFNYIPEPEIPPTYNLVNNIKQYKRSKKKATNALKRSGFKCEYNQEHESFIKRNSNIRYTEPHHLIPLSCQDKFENSLDVEANLVSLCSNCHNEIHYGKNYKAIIEKLYEIKIAELEEAGIEISMEELIKIY